VPNLVHPSERTAFGKYTLIARLATGGMGEIFLARLSGVAGFEKLVVIKRVLPHLAAQDRFIAMLLDEARIVARLSHPNICQVQELGEVDGEYYIAMEYLEGITVADLLRRLSKQGHVMDPRIVIAMTVQACEGLHAAHELVDRGGQPTNLVHRDVSPSNVFITTAGMVKVLDFGIAKTPDRLARTRTGAVKGKWAYMSPEQILRQPLDRRSDIFSLGIVLFESLTGWRLFHHPSEYQICRAITETDAPSVRNFQPALPEPLAQVVARALSRDPTLRFATARDMGKALLEASASLGGPSILSDVADLVSANFTKELAERRAFVERVEASAEHGADAAPASLLPVAPLMTPEIPSGDEFPDPMPQVGTSATQSAPPPEPPADDRPPMPAPASGPVSAPASGPVPMAAPFSTSGPADLASAAHVAGVADGPAARATGRIPEQAPSGRGLMALAALAVLSAAATYAYVTWWPRGVEVQPRIETERGQVVAEQPDPRAQPVAIDAAMAVVSPDAGAEVVAGEDPAQRPSRPSRRDPYQRGLSRRGAQLTRCYQDHVSERDSAPLLKLVMKIDTTGRVLVAHVEPAAYNATELGRCVLGQVRGINFGAHDAPAEVAIPLNIRMKRAD
jgi:serine/threonine protein kinase